MVGIVKHVIPVFSFHTWQVFENLSGVKIKKRTKTNDMKQTDKTIDYEWLTRTKRRQV